MSTQEIIAEMDRRLKIRGDYYGYVKNAVEDMMRETGDTELIAVEWGEDGKEDDGCAFWVWSESYIYFMRTRIMPYSDGDSDWDLGCLPLRSGLTSPFIVGNYS